MNRKQFREFKSNVRSFGVNLKYEYIKCVFAQQSEDAVCRLLNLLETDTELNESFRNQISPKNFADLDATRYSINPKIGKEMSLFVVSKIINLFIIDIKIYVYKKRQFEELLFQNKYSEAFATVLEIEEKLGISIWSISQKLLLSELSGGLESNKKFMTLTLEKISKNLLIKTIIPFLSNKMELNTSYSNYVNSVNSYTKAIGERIVVNLFQYHLNPEYIFDYKHKENFTLLQFNSYTSLIDMYECFVEILQYSAQEIDFNYDYLYLYNEVSDPRLLNLSLVVEKIDFSKFTKYFETNEFMNLTLDNYSKSNYKDCLIMTKQFLKEGMGSFQARLLFVKTLIYLEKNDVTNEIDNSLMSILNYDSNYKESFKRLQNNLKIYSNTSWKHKLKYIIDRSQGKCDFINKKMFYLNDDIITPTFSNILASGEKKLFLEEVKYFSPYTEKLISIKSSNSIAVHNDKRYMFYKAKAFYESCQYEKAIEVLDELSTEEVENNYVFERNGRLLFNCLVKLGNYEKAIELSTNLYFRNKNLIQKWPLESIVMQCCDFNNEKISSNIKTPIYIYISNPQDINRIRVSFSNFIEKNHINDSTSLLAFAYDNYEYYEFFLSKICCKEILSKDYSFGVSADKVQEIRGEILKYLLEKDETNKLYREELTAITTKTQLSAQIKKLNSNKIYVQVDAIKNDPKMFFKEDFKKYLIMKDTNFNGAIEINLYDKSYLEAMIDYVDKVDENRVNNAEFNQNISLLESIIGKIVDRFLNDEIYGLDTFLSSRIRHGYCKNQLTKSLKESNLLSKKIDDKSEEFSVNEYWDKKLSEYPEEIAKEVMSSISKFTMQIESKVDEVKQKWIHIKTNSDTTGLFDFSNAIKHIALNINVQGVRDFETFFNEVVESLWGITDESLGIIRGKIENDLLMYFINKLIELEANLKMINTSNKDTVISKICNEIAKCKSTIKNVVFEFSSVFYRNNENYNDFTLLDIVTTSKEVAQNLYSSFSKIQFSENIEYKKPLRGVMFPYFIDIMNILINNSIIHSKISDLSKIHINVEAIKLIGKEKDIVLREARKVLGSNVAKINKDLQIIKLSVKNNLDAKLNLEEVEHKLSEAFNRMENDSSPKKLFTQTEGGTGIYKLKNILKFNIDLDHLITYDINKVDITATMNIYLVLKMEV